MSPTPASTPATTPATPPSATARPGPRPAQSGDRPHRAVPAGGIRQPEGDRVLLSPTTDPDHPTRTARDTGHPRPLADRRGQRAAGGAGRRRGARRSALGLLVVGLVLALG